MKPTKSILDPEFPYVHSTFSNIRSRFDAERERLREERRRRLEETNARSPTVWITDREKPA